MTDEAKHVVEALRICHSNKDCRDCKFVERDKDEKSCVNILFDESANLLESLSAELEQVKRERDVAVEDLKQAAIYLCCACRKYHRAIPGKSHHYCEEIGKREDFEGAIACGMFEWRGVKEDT